MKLLSKRLSIIILFFIPFIIYFSLIISGKTLYYRDLYIQEYPLITYIIEVLKNGEIPLWNPYLFSGFPQMESLQPPIFYPPMFIFALLPFDYALDFILILHYFFAGFGIYLLCKEYELDEAPSILAGLTFALNGFMFELNNLIYILFSITWMPFILLYLEKLIKKVSLKDFCSLSFFITLSLATQRLDFIYLFFLSLLIYLPVKLFKVLKDDNFKEIAKKALILILAPLFSICIIAIQLFPSVNYMTSTIRTEGVPLDEAVKWSLYPVQLFNFISGNLLGNFYYNDGFISKVVDPVKNNDGFFIYNLYFGIISLIMIFYGLVKAKKNFLLVFISLFFIILSLGYNTPIYSFFYNYFPYFKTTRFPIKILFVAIFYLALLAGYGFKQLFDSFKDEDLESKIKYKNYLLLTISLLIIMLLIPYLVSNESLNIVLKNSSLTLTMLILFISLTYFRILNKITYNNFIYLVLILISIDYMQFSFSNLWKIDRASFYKEHEVVKDIKNNLRDINLYRMVQDTESIKYSLFKDDTSNGLKNFVNYQETFNMNLSNMHSIMSSSGSSPVRPYKITYLLGALEDHPSIPTKVSDQIKARIMSITGAEIYLKYKYNCYNPQSKKLDEQYFELIKDYQKESLELWKLKKPKPIYSFTTKSMIVNNEETSRDIILDYIKSPFDNNIVIIEDNSNYKKALEIVPKKINNEVEQVKLEIVYKNNNSYGLNIENNKIGYLVISNNYFDGWKAYDNDVEVPILNANYYQQAIRLNTGKHKIDMKYEPKYYALGRNITYISLVVFIILIALSIFI